MQLQGKSEVLLTVFSPHFLFVLYLSHVLFINSSEHVTKAVFLIVGLCISRFLCILSKLTSCFGFSEHEL